MSGKRRQKKEFDGDALSGRRRASDEDESTVVEVLEVNWPSVAVYSTCQAEVSIGMGGAVHRNIPAQELEAACNLLDIPQQDRPDITADVKYMAAVVADKLNEKTAKESSKRNRSHGRTSHSKARRG